MKFNFEQKIDLYNEGFEDEGNDLLHRRKTGSALSSLLNRTEDPLVVTLDGEWGSGKTNFLKRWVGQHLKENKDSTVVYIDAFAHDYISDPLPALVTALEGRTNNKNIKRMKRAAFNIAKVGTRVGLAVATSGASVAVGKVGEEITKALGGQAQMNLEEYWEQEKGRSDAMEQFREALESMVSAKKNNKVIIVIDELDRCRPDYALEVLEIIKHFFSVDNVHFVLGINLNALEDMVSTRYGAKIDAREYLQKFIQIKLELPDEIRVEDGQKQNVLSYLDYLCREMKIPDHIGKWLKIRIKLVSRANPVSLRHIEHIVSAVALASSEALEYENDNSYYGSIYSIKIPEGRFAVMVDLIISRIVCPELHPRFLDATISGDDLKLYLGDQGNGMSGHENNEWQWAYDTWLFLAGGEMLKHIGVDLFGTSFVPLYHPGEETRELPKKLEREWLDPFRFYKPIHKEDS